MKQIVKFQVTIEKSRGNWIVSDKFENLNDAEKWRSEQTIAILKEQPGRRAILSNLIIERTMVED